MKREMIHSIIYSTESLSKNGMVIMGERGGGTGIGYDAARINSAIGKYGIRDKCANGELLFRFFMNFLLIHTFGKKKSSHMEFLGQPNFNQIYYTLISFLNR